MRRLLTGAIAMVLALAPHSVGGSDSGPVRVEVVETGSGFELRRGGEPFFIEGVGGARRLELLAESGGNAVRTWGQQELDHLHVGPDGVERPLLDHAHELGLVVAAGYWMEHPRHGFDYSDEAAVRAQLDRLAEWVRAHKDHPALLLWGIGNEVEINTDLETVLPHLNDAARLVKSIDPHHPTMVVVAELGEDMVKARRVMELCPDVDILGVNSYGGVLTVGERLASIGFDRPYVVTEFGHLGHWETGATPWGAVYEPTSTQKAERLAEGYRAAIDGNRAHCLGGFAFLWGHKQERTGTWYGVFLETGERTAMHDALVRAWTGEWPEDRAPGIEPLRFHPEGSEPGDLTVAPGARIDVSVKASDPDGDRLRFEWLVREESTDHRAGGDREAVPPVVEVAFDDAGAARTRMTAPGEPGAYRVFVTVYDGNGSAATANAPFLVE